MNLRVTRQIARDAKARSTNLPDCVNSRILTPWQGEKDERSGGIAKKSYKRKVNKKEIYTLARWRVKNPALIKRIRVSLSDVRVSSRLKIPIASHVNFVNLAPVFKIEPRWLLCAYAPLSRAGFLIFIRSQIYKSDAAEGGRSRTRFAAARSRLERERQREREEGAQGSNDYPL